MGTGGKLTHVLEPESMIGGLAREQGEALIPGASWYVARAPGDGLCYRFRQGALAEATFLTADLLVAGNQTVVFALQLQEGEEGPRFTLAFSVVNQCQARMRMPLEAVKLNWGCEREGAWLKPGTGGDRVDLSKVDRMTLTVTRKSDHPARFCLTAVTATAEEPARLDDPILPEGPLLDELGQSTLHDWPTKSRGPEEVTERLQAQLRAAPQARFPDNRSRWGGWSKLRFEGTGFFRTHHDGRRWWLVDPDGCAFWSAGAACVGVNNLVSEAGYTGLEKALSWMPDREGEYGEVYTRGWGRTRAISYLMANLIRAFGDDWHLKWSQITLAELRRLGLNTFGTGSDWRVAREAGFPHTRTLHSSRERTARVFRDFPDVYHPDFAEEAAEFATQLEETRDDPAFIGYFLMNEPTWGFAQETPAAGMLFNSPRCDTRHVLREFLKEKYGSDAGLSAAWGIDTTLGAVGEGEWKHRLTEAAREDLAGFSTIMVAKLFETLSDACKKVDPNHLNLGARYYTVPPQWALEGMKCFDVFSVNGYWKRLSQVGAELKGLSEQVGRPVMIGEWHFGALDVGLPASGIGHVRDQRARGQAYRVYLEDAAAHPWCVGAHWFTLYDESALGEPSAGENWNIGLLDICNRPYEELTEAVRASHERLYDLGAGDVAPYDEAPEYLPLLYF